MTNQQLAINELKALLQKIQVDWEIPVDLLYTDALSRVSESIEKRITELEEQAAESAGCCSGSCSRDSCASNVGQALAPRWHILPLDFLEDFETWATEFGFDLSKTPAMSAENPYAVSETWKLLEAYWKGREDQHARTLKIAFTYLEQPSTGEESNPADFVNEFFDRTFSALKKAKAPLLVWRADFEHAAQKVGVNLYPGPDATADIPYLYSEAHSGFGFYCLGRSFSLIPDTSSDDLAPLPRGNRPLTQVKVPVKLVVIEHITDTDDIFDITVHQTLQEADAKLAAYASEHWGDRFKSSAPFAPSDLSPHEIVDAFFATPGEPHVTLAYKVYDETLTLRLPSEAELAPLITLLGDMDEGWLDAAIQKFRQETTKPFWLRVFGSVEAYLLEAAKAGWEARGELQAVRANEYYKLAPTPTNLREWIERGINHYSAENGSDTPDFILAEFLMDALTAFDRAVSARSAWTNSWLTTGLESRSNCTKG